MAETVGFEPTVAFQHTLLFESSTIILTGLEPVPASSVMLVMPCGLGHEHGSWELPTPAPSILA